ncbi:hypothetical protein EXIGLDRAFT_832558 [Exidia glandulosa HHB12029]|uniref:Extracellular membrane protein CFEM domain-containing protein n=1 Tax=Exidia glandulosa HHB12029 TaxID=1314781 RepID=A0A165LK91_EXIGL|nr:hypothetical protein EXIGLDRAFT_832558 [Exidia glandulosa HHB12029]
MRVALLAFTLAAVSVSVSFARPQAQTQTPTDDDTAADEDCLSQCSAQAGAAFPQEAQQCLAFTNDVTQLGCICNTQDLIGTIQSCLANSCPEVGPLVDELCANPELIDETEAPADDTPLPTDAGASAPIATGATGSVSPTAGGSASNTATSPATTTTPAKKGGGLFAGLVKAAGQAENPSGSGSGGESPSGSPASSGKDTGTGAGVRWTARSARVLLALGLGSVFVLAL